MRTYRRGLMLLLWGRGLLLAGLVGAAASAAPALLLATMPTFDPGFFGLVATLLALSVTPLMLVVASAGAILLLAGAVRRWRDRA